jgi:hypothetical protein
MTEQVNPAPRLDNQDPGLFGQTPSQTVGPFFHYGLPWKGGADLVGQSDMGARPELFPEDHYVLNLAPPKGAVSGEVIILEGVVYDADGKPVPDAMIEIWQANAAGRYASPDDDPHRDSAGRGLHRLWPRLDQRGRPVPLQDRAARRRAGSGQQPAGAAHRGQRVRSRHHQAAGHPGLFRGPGGQRPTRSWPWSPPSAATP